MNSNICWLLLLVPLFVAAGPCTQTISVLNATECMTNVTWSSNTTVYQHAFPIGPSVMSYTDDGVDCLLHVTVQTQSNVSVCGDFGACSSSPPFDCICLQSTVGDYCCSETTPGGNSSCAGRGDCVVGGECSCKSGYGGPWCCPIDLASQLVCSGNGCCMASGECLCDDTSNTNIVCAADTSFTQPQIITIATIGSVVAVTTVAVIGYAVVSAAAVSGATSATGGAAYGTLVAARARLSSWMTE